jgi:N-acetylneuraminic acid mutarotase
MKYSILLFLLLGFSSNAQEWKTLKTNTESTSRSENSLIAAGNKLYLFGGRGIKPLEVFDPKTNSWEKRSNIPLEIHHFQAVTYNGEIYVLGALTGPYPHETPIPNIYIYNPDKDEWRVGAEIPRKRGAAGAFVYKNKIYMVCGIQDGHWDGHVTWFDEYDPKTGKWKELSDAPRARDHINVTVVGDKLVVAGGRRSSGKTNQVFELVIPETDIYDFKTGKWSTAQEPIPTTRAGNAAITLNNQAVFIGGESHHQIEAHDEVEAFDPKTMKWKSLPKLNQGRHGMSATKLGDKYYISSGVSKRGGSPEQNSMECL